QRERIGRIRHEHHRILLLAALVASREADPQLVIPARTFGADFMDERVGQLQRWKGRFRDRGGWSWARGRIGGNSGLVIATAVGGTAACADNGQGECEPEILPMLHVVALYHLTEHHLTTIVRVITAGRTDGGPLPLRTPITSMRHSPGVGRTSESRWRKRFSSVVHMISSFETRCLSKTRMRAT